ncbi:hypothetical protein ABZP36_029022 [Zizania latifolia]
MCTVHCCSARYSAQAASISAIPWTVPTEKISNVRKRPTQQWPPRVSLRLPAASCTRVDRAHAPLSPEEEGEEVESKVKEEGGLGIHGLGTLESLEDALPIKRGLSNFYAGKSKSFTSLAEAAAKAAAKEIAKPENPFNKRRRVLAAWSRRHASCSSLVTTYLPPLLALDHTVVEEDEEDSDTEQCSNSNDGARRRQEPTFPPPRLSLHAQRSTMTARSPSATTSSFRSPRSFSLSDLQNAG